MKKLLLICLLAGYGQCFAQNLDLKDIQRILESQVVEVINPLLAPKGYAFSGRSNALQWGFRSSANPEAANLAQVTLATDTAGTRVIYETTNAFFYTNLLNQLSANNYLYRSTTAVDDQINMVFSNGKYELLLNLIQDDSPERYRLTLQPATSFIKRS